MATEGNANFRSLVLEALRPVERAVNSATRHVVQARWEAMLRELAYLQEKRDVRLHFVTGKGWSMERLAVLCWCNSFYQLVIGPLESSLRVSTLSLGTLIPIWHGTEYFDRRRAGRTQRTTSEFAAIIVRLGFQRNWLFKNTASDVLYYVERYERDNDAMFDNLDEP
jgi:hypothetical protein